MGIELLEQLGFSKAFIEHIQNFPQYQFYKQPGAGINKLQVAQQIKDDLIITNPGLGFNDLRIQHFRNTANII